MDTVRILVGVHFGRHFGGPGHVTVSPGSIVVTDRKERRRVVQTAPVVRLERKRWEPPTGNHWIEVTDGEQTCWLTASRRRAARVVAALEAAGFTVERAAGLAADR